MAKYDFVVIGSGGGLMFIEGALGYNKKCAIVENSKFGGTCLIMELPQELQQKEINEKNLIICGRAKKHHIKVFI